MIWCEQDRINYYKTEFCRREFLLAHTVINKKQDKTHLCNNTIISHQMSLDNDKKKKKFRETASVQVCSRSFCYTSCQLIHHHHHQEQKKCHFLK